MVFSVRSRHSRANRSNNGRPIAVEHRLLKTVVIVGMMGAGKTAIGQALARRLDVPFRDSDAEIERAAAATVSEIFARDGEAFFRDKEAQVIARLLAGAPGILATGGGAFIRRETRTRVSAEAISVWLRADLELLWARVRHKTTRPLLRTDDPKGTLQSLYEARTPAYGDADLVVDAHKRYSIEDMTNRVIEALLTRPDVLATGAA